MELADSDLLDLFLSRKEPEGELCRPEVCDVLGLMRPGHISASSNETKEIP